ncbi:MAG: HlyD family efflux transporter periplasmic adaptor subunit [Bacteroidia bacterium]|nr:MAG: HlyD family efflux transporter periplasmic adaptor subunit [Bacteroidia bacterium]
MNRNTHYFLRFALLPAVFILMAISCRQQNGDQGSGSAAEAAAQDVFVTEVDIMVLEEGVFPRELLSNGKLRALRKSRLPFRYSEELLRVHVLNGQYVSAGEVLAELCRENLERQLARAAITRKQATLEMEYLLLGHGFTLGDSLKVPAHIWEMAGISSGYLEARNQYKNLLADLEKTRLTAPFGGLISGIETQPYEQVTAGNIFGTLIDNTAFIAAFSVMENELPLIGPGGHVQVIPFSMPGIFYTGTIKSIDPVVDENGLIRVTALITDTEGLLEGMNVRVIARQEISGQMAVPRAAVLYRDNLEVLFRYENGESVWTYVNILYENSTHYSVIANPDRVASLHPGDTVIIGGNMNLAHGSAVNIR